MSGGPVTGSYQPDGRITDPYDTLDRVIGEAPYRISSSPRSNSRFGILLAAGVRVR
jgi:hypothetical protein